MMYRDLVATAFMFIAVFLFIIAWPDMIMLGIAGAVFAIISVILVVDRRHEEGTS